MAHRYAESRRAARAAYAERQKSAGHVEMRRWLPRDEAAWVDAELGARKKGEGAEARHAAAAQALDLSARKSQRDFAAVTKALAAAKSQRWRARAAAAFGALCTIALGGGWLWAFQQTTPAPVLAETPAISRADAAPDPRDERIAALEEKLARTVEEHRFSAARAVAAEAELEKVAAELSAAGGANTEARAALEASAAALRKELDKLRAEGKALAGKLWAAEKYLADSRRWTATARAYLPPLWLDRIGKAVAQKRKKAAAEAKAGGSR